MSFKRRHTQDKNKTSRKKRLRGISKYHERECHYLEEMIEDIGLNSVVSMFLGDQELIEETNRLEDMALSRWYELRHYDSQRFQKLRKNTLKASQILSIDAALVKCGAHKDHEFRIMFKFSPEELKRLSLLLPSQFKSNQKHGSINREVAIMYVCARMKGADSDLRKIASFFGRDEAHISEFYHLVTSYILHAYGHLLDIRQMERWRRYLPAWERAYNLKIHQKLDQGDIEVNLGRFEGCNVIMDGIRLYVAQPSNHQKASLLITLLGE